jgi:branched-chain amino acid aminotransferase
MSLIWINGRLVDKTEARISVFDHGFLYGDGVWEPLRVFGGKTHEPQPHLVHLFDAARRAGIEVPLSMDEARTAIEETVRANNRGEGYIRVIVTRGSGTLGPDPRKIDPQVIIIVEEYFPFPRELYEHGLNVVSVRVGEPNRDFKRSLSGAWIVEAKQCAVKNGCLDALLVTPPDRVIGCIEGDIFIVSNGAIITAPSSAVEMASGYVGSIAKHEAIPWAPRSSPLPLADVIAANEAFLAGTSCGIIGIVQVDGKSIGAGRQGPVTQRIRTAYHLLTRGES